MRSLTLMLALCACGPLRGPYADLQAGGACAQDSDCALADCPNACNRGRPLCEVPPVFVRSEMEKRCPCLTQPAGASGCSAPIPSTCGPQAGCVAPDFSTMQARCLRGNCGAVFGDAGLP